MSPGFLHRYEVRFLKETLIDIETYCEADIKKCGLYRYTSDPSFEILLIAWAQMRAAALAKQGWQTLHLESRFRRNFWTISRIAT